MIPVTKQTVAHAATLHYPPTKRFLKIPSYLFKHQQPIQGKLLPSILVISYFLLPRAI